MAKTKRTKATEEAPEAEGAAAQIIGEHQVAEARAAKQESATGTTPTLASMKIGTKLHRMYHGKRYDAEVIAGEGDAHLLRVKGKGDAKSLSAGASLISNHAERGALVWRTEDGKNLLPGGGAPKYGAMAAKPPTAKPSGKAKASAKRAARPKDGNGQAGTVKTRFQCGGCQTKHPTSAEAATCASSHPAK